MRWTGLPPGQMPIWASSALGQAQAQAQELVPHIPGRQALDDAVDARGVELGSAQLAQRQAWQRPLHGAAAPVVEDPLRLEQAWQGLTSIHSRAEIGQATDLAGQRPQHQWRRAAFAGQTLQEARAA